MKLPRRNLLLAAGAAALPAMSRFAWAQAYPTRPVRIIVGFAPAGGTDIMARLIGQWLSERLGQQFVIENRPGAASNIGTEMVVNAPPDGYTLLVATFVNAVNATLYDKLNFNFIRDIAPVASIAREPFAIEVHPSVPVKTVPEFITHAKANRVEVLLYERGERAEAATLLDKCLSPLCAQATLHHRRATAHRALGALRILKICDQRLASEIG